MKKTAERVQINHHCHPWWWVWCKHAVIYYSYNVTEYIIVLQFGWAIQTLKSGWVLWDVKSWANLHVFHLWLVSHRMIGFNRCGISLINLSQIERLLCFPNIFVDVFSSEPFTCFPTTSKLLETPWFTEVLRQTMINSSTGLKKPPLATAFLLKSHRSRESLFRFSLTCPA